MANGGGMYLEVMPTGSKYWRLKYRFQELEKRLALGVYPEITLADARKRRDIARKQLGNGMKRISPDGIGTGRADRNIAADLKGTLEAFERGHFKAISTDQIPEFLTALKKNDARLSPQTIRATTLLMLTFVPTSDRDFTRTTRTHPPV